MSKVVLITVLSGSISGASANSTSDVWVDSNSNDPMRESPIMGATKVGRGGMPSLNLVYRGNVTEFSIEFLRDNRFVGPNKFEYKLERGEVKSFDEVTEVWFGVGNRVLISNVGRQGNIASRLVGSLIEVSEKEGEGTDLTIRATTMPGNTTEILDKSGIESFLNRCDPYDWYVYDGMNDDENDDEGDVVNPAGAGFEEGDSRIGTVRSNTYSFKYKKVIMKLTWFDGPPYKNSETLPIRTGVEPKISIEPFKEYSLSEFLVKFFESPPDVVFLYNNDDEFLFTMT